MPEPRTREIVRAADKFTVSEANNGLYAVSKVGANESLFLAFDQETAEALKVLLNTEGARLYVRSMP